MSETNRAVQPQMTTRSLKFQIKEGEGLDYLFSENKGTEQLCGHHAAKNICAYVLHMQKAGYLMTQFIF